LGFVLFQPSNKGRLGRVEDDPVIMKRVMPLLVSCACAISVVAAHETADQSQPFFKEGMRASMQRDWEGAVENYNKAIQANPNLIEAYMERAAIFQITKRPEDAITDYRRVLELNPGHYHAMERLAAAYEEKGDYSRAAEWYGKALELVSDPKWRSIIKARRDRSLEKMRTGRQGAVH
jgi:tetratricopeptide (TPR) repeat protein